MVHNIEIADFYDDDYSSDDYYTEDSIETYLKEMGSFPLLSRDEERKLARLISQGDKKAKDTFLKSNLRLVVSIARKYNYGTLPFLDLIQEGNIGLMKAIDKFDVDKGYKFSTYAVNWIRKSITSAIYNDGRNIRIPVDMYSKISAYRKIYGLLEARYNREPTIEEMALELNISIESALELNKIQRDTVSLYTLIGSDSDSENELLNFISSCEEGPESVAINKNLSIELRKAMNNSTLTDKEINVIFLRFGLNDNNPRTLEEVGKIYGVTRERIRQIESKALRKLRRNIDIKNMRIYIDDSAQMSPKLNGTIREVDKVARKLNSIYENMRKKGYFKKQVDDVIAELSSEELKLLYARYGGNLEKPVVNNEWSSKQNAMYYGKLVPKIERMLSEKSMNISDKKVVNVANDLDKEVVVASNVANNSDKKVGNVANDLDKEVVVASNVANDSDKKVVNVANGSNGMVTSIISDENCDLNRDNYVKILEMMKKPSFDDMLKVLSPKEAVIACLRLGYVDGKYFTTESISGFLGVSEDEVLDTTKKVLSAYKESINSFIDRAIDIISDKPVTFSKKK